MKMDKSNNLVIITIIVAIATSIQSIELDSPTYQPGQQQRYLTTELLQSGAISYDKIHEFAIRDQIKYHKQIILSHSTRITKNLDGLYDFCLDYNDEGFAKNWFVKSISATCPPNKYHRMPVPSAFNDITSDHQVRNFMGWVWYQREVILPFNVNNKPKDDWSIHFESANYLTIVWAHVIGTENCTKLLVSHVGGHLPFAANLRDLTSCEYDRKETSQYRSTRVLLTMAVSNMLNANTIPSGSMLNLTSVVGKPYEQFKPDFDFFHFSGLIGSINLLKIPKIHWNTVKELIDENSIKSTRHFEACLSESFGYRAKRSAHIEAHLSGFDHDGTKCPVEFASSANNDHCYNITIQSDCIQQNSNKFATLTLMYSKRSSLIDTFEHRIASPKKRILKHDLGLVEINILTGQEMNHDPMMLKGFGMHHEQYFSGRTMSLPAIMKDLNLIKWTGANLIRTSHYPYSTAYLDACDELGISVIAECQAVGLRSYSDIKLALHKQLLLEMMQRDHLHPSIIAWSVANEPQSQLPAAKPYFESLLSYARNELSQYTKTRPLTAAIAQSHNDDKIGHTLDFIMINHYFGWYDYPSVIDAIRLPLINSLSGWSKLHPGKGLIISEFGADTIAGLHSFSPNSDIFSEEYQRDLILKHEEIFNDLWCLHTKNNTLNTTQIPFLGSMVWNFADFSTDVSLLRVGGNRKGVFTRDRNPKMAAQTIRAAYLNKTICS